MYLDVSAYQDYFRVGGMCVILGIASCLVGQQAGRGSWPAGLAGPVGITAAARPRVVTSLTATLHGRQVYTHTATTSLFGHVSPSSILDGDQTLYHNNRNE